MITRVKAFKHRAAESRMKSPPDTSGINWLFSAVRKDEGGLIKAAQLQSASIGPRQTLPSDWASLHVGVRGQLVSAGVINQKKN